MELKNLFCVVCFGSGVGWVSLREILVYFSL